MPKTPFDPAGLSNYLATLPLGSVNGAIQKVAAKRRDETAVSFNVAGCI